MTRLQESVARVAEEHGFSGVVRVDRAGRPELADAYGLAERGFRRANTLDTQFAIASGCKGFTALTVMCLVDEGRLDLTTTARSVLGDDLPEIDDRVTVEQLLAHRSGIGDYIDEEADLAITDYVMSVPVHELAITEGYLPALAGHAAKFAPGQQFSYCNSGYVVLALIAERVAGTPFHDLVNERVCLPAGMHDTAFLRSDELPARAARGYLQAEGLRTNVLHLPVRGSGDGGIYTTVSDVHAFWQALFAGRIVSPHQLADMLRARSDLLEWKRRYGLGFWLYATGNAVRLTGSDAGVSFQSVHDPDRDLTWTVMANTSEGAWDVADHLGEALADR
ncbi:MAG: serine hydrolase domain-containing protein [Nocardioidaceae bacterium]